MKIVDFGLAKLEESSRLTQTGATLGTLAYMSPEQASGEETDKRTDLWSLGIVLYEMLTGHKPFRGNSMASVVNAVVHKAPEPITGIPWPFLGSVEHLMSRLLTKDPEDRYVRAEDFLHDLQPLIGQSSSEQGRDTTWLAPEVSKRRRRWPPWLPIAAIVFLVGGTGFWLSQLTGGPETNHEPHPLSGSEQAALLVEQARDLFEGNDPNRGALSVELFRQALERDPKSFDARIGLAEGLVFIAARDSDQNLYDEAEKVVTIAIQDRPESLEAGIVLARVLMGTDRLDPAIRTLRRLTARNPKNADVHGWFARTLKKAGEPAEAEAHFRQAVVLSPNDWRKRNELGTFYWKIGQMQEATIAFREAADVAPAGVSWPLENLASVALSTGEYEKAIEIYSELPRPITEAIVASNIGTAYLYLGDLEEAERHYRIAVRLEPRGQTYRLNLGDCLDLAGDQEGAQAAYRGALDLSLETLLNNPNDISLALRHALLLAKSGDCKQALEATLSLRERIAGTASEYFRLAEPFALCGDHASSLSTLHKAVEKGYPRSELRMGEELRSLRGDEEFEELAREAG